MTTTLGPETIFLDSPAGLAMMCLSSPLYVAALAGAIWKRWPLSMGLLMLASGYASAMWLSREKQHAVELFAAVLAIPVLLIIFGVVSAAGRLVRQWRVERAAHKH